MTELSAKFLETLRRHGGYMTRRELAKAIGRPGHLGAYDLQLLDGLIAEGLIEASRHASGPVRKTWVYRAK